MVLIIYSGELAMAHPPTGGDGITNASPRWVLLNTANKSRRSPIYRINFDPTPNWRTALKAFLLLLGEVFLIHVNLL
ncbi:hypothetical protein NIES4074_15420 [Cylindrospermum sp. NIES-4074]|nr:hypothetical protein NIES4074_15420 [Cylindrospermum sp. NIES-4074]